MIAVLSPKSKYARFQYLPSFTCSDKAFTSGLALGCVYIITVYYSIPVLLLSLLFKHICFRWIAERIPVLKTVKLTGELNKFETDL